MVHAACPPSPPAKRRRPSRLARPRLPPNPSIRLPLHLAANSRNTKHPRGSPTRWWASELEPGVAALVTLIAGATDAAQAGGAVVVGELVSAGQELTGLGVLIGVGAASRGQVVLGARDRGAAVRVTVGGAEVLRPRQRRRQDVRARMARRGCACVGNQQQFGVGRRGVGGQPVQLCCRQLVGVIDDQQAAHRYAAPPPGLQVVDPGLGRGGGVGVAVLAGVGGGRLGRRQRQDAVLMLMSRSSDGGQDSGFVDALAQAGSNWVAWALLAIAITARSDCSSSPPNTSSGTRYIAAGLRPPAASRNSTSACAATTSAAKASSCCPANANAAARSRWRTSARNASALG